MRSPEKDCFCLTPELAFDKGYWDYDNVKDSYFPYARNFNFSSSERAILEQTVKDVALSALEGHSSPVKTPYGWAIKPDALEVGTVVLVDIEELRNAADGSWSHPTLGPQPGSRTQLSYLLNCSSLDLVNIQWNKAGSDSFTPPKIVIRSTEVQGLEEQKWQYSRSARFGIIVPGKESGNFVYEPREIGNEYNSLRDKFLAELGFDLQSRIISDATVGQVTYADYRGQPDDKIPPTYQRLLGVNIYTAGQSKLAELLKQERQNRRWLGKSAVRKLCGAGFVSDSE
jgi:hypothetical protein